MEAAEFKKSSLTYGQHELDVRLKRFLTGSHGFYIESGAFNGQQLSNTNIYSLQRCWAGLLVEPSIAGAAAARLSRPRDFVVNAALVDCAAKGVTVKGAFHNDPMSRVDSAYGDVEVSARTLTDLLEEHRVEHVHWWSLDVEGFELAALKGLDFSRWAPDYINLELWHNDSAVWDFLAARGYSFVADISPWKYATPHRDVIFRSPYALQSQAEDTSFTYEHLPTY
jgi:FkbM family methyltransferase